MKGSVGNLGRPAHLFYVEYFFYVNVMQMRRSSRMHDSIMLIFTTLSGDDRLEVIQNVISTETRTII